ncbi:MAG: hypothetical protein LBQ01_02980 [Prevotellaceae bacterium]|jgi:phage repressor protein C with HTH and peptisase S24 domain|nr:hypothetical protein [Prevotellaceae bacterium]
MQENSLIKKNILKFIEYKGFSKYKFYQKTGITRGILDQNNGMSEENTAKFLTYFPEIDANWLVTGEGEMLKKDIEMEDNKEMEEPVMVSDIGKGIPYVTPQAVAGFGSDDFSISEQDVKDYYTIPMFKHYHIDFMIDVRGSSMVPKYNSGDVIACTIINERTFIQWNKCHVIATREQGIIVKRLRPSEKDGYLTAVSDNKEYPPFDVPVSEITGLALVVGVIRLDT